MILPAITACGVQKHDVLSSLARLLVEDLALAPHGRRDIHVPANDAVFVGLVLTVFGSRAGESVVQQLQNPAPDVGPASERVLQEMC